MIGWGRRVSTTKAPAPLARARILRRLLAERGRQSCAGALDGFRFCLERLTGFAPDRAGDPDCTDGLASKIFGRNGNATHFEIEFALIKRDPGALDVCDLAQKGRHLGNRFLS